MAQRQAEWVLCSGYLALSAAAPSSDRISNVPPRTSKMARLFIGVRVETTRPLSKALDELGVMGRAVKPVAEKNLHVTLKFLGENDLDLVPEISRVMQQVAATKPESDIRLVGLGAFPHAQRPSVIWAGMQNAETLIEVAAGLDKQLRPLGFGRDKKAFQPHLTLARVRSKPPPELASMLAELRERQFGVVSVSRVQLFQSELQPHGPQYTVLATAEFSDGELPSH